jgi:asparagine synthase (glutamine-hydrolysing)
MCGIAGVYEYGRSEGSVAEALVLRMRETLFHRGPDGEGLFISQDRRVGLGSRRLAIVDIAGGDQPMFGRNGEVLVFNGEIYNYPTLRRELERQGVSFETDCDTEVVVRLYELHGERCVDFLNGMFAFAVWDPRRERLFFARDRVGEKPLYWTQTDGRFVFGSEIKALLEHPGVAAAVQVDAIPEYLTNLVVSSPRTLYKGIYKLGAGEAGSCERGGVRVWRYWDLFQPRTPTECSLEEAAATVRQMLDRSVHDRLMSDVPVGVLLSGGLDSTTLVALLRERAKGLATFSVGFSESPRLDERAAAKRVAEHFSTDHHEVTVSQQEGLEFLTRLVYHQDEPLADPVCIPLHFVCELARKNDIKVVLAGEGADELFWGYPRYEPILSQLSWMSYVLRLPSSARRVLPYLVPPQRPEIRELLEHLAVGRPPPLHMPLGLLRRHRQSILRGSDETLLSGWRPSNIEDTDEEDPLLRLTFDTQEYEFALRLPELLLMRIDRFSMANSVEARVPFLEPSLVEFAYRLPLTQKLVDGNSKVVLKQAVSDIVPHWVINRPKQGFGAPVQDWLQSGLGTLFERLIDTDAMKTYFRPNVLRVALHKARNARGTQMRLWPVINFALWHRYWIEGDSIEEIIRADQLVA